MDKLILRVIQQRGTVELQSLVLRGGVRRIHVSLMRPFNDSKALEVSLEQLNALLIGPCRAWLRWVCGVGSSSSSSSLNSAPACLASPSDVAQAHTALLVMKQQLKPSASLWYSNAINAAINRLTNYRRSVHSHVRTDTAAAAAASK